MGVDDCDGTSRSAPRPDLGVVLLGTLSISVDPDALAGAAVAPIRDAVPGVASVSVRVLAGHSDAAGAPDTVDEVTAVSAAAPLGTTGCADSVVVTLRYEGPVPDPAHARAVATRAAGTCAAAFRLGEHLRHIRTTNSDLLEACTSRAVIDQAIGIVMASRRCDAPTAFDQLRREADRRQVKVRDLARSLVGRVGGTPSRPTRQFQERVTPW